MEDLQRIIESKVEELQNVIDEQTRLIIRLQFEVAELEHSALKRENNILRKSINDTNKQYVEVVNENLRLKRKLEENGIY